jgi:hypothetical protein
MMKKIDTWLDIQRYIRESEDFAREEMIVAEEESVLSRS